MKEHPIIFSGPMVRAILEGRKTQTRRVLKPQPPFHEFSRYATDRLNIKTRGGQFVHCPYGKPGDRLWVRETWAEIWPGDVEVPLRDCNIEYRADLPVGCTDYPGGWPANEARGYEDCPKWRSSLHMPRWVSRITLKITDVRVQRVQEISYDDCCRETGSPLQWEGPGPEPYHRQMHLVFHQLWDSINAKRGYSWASNPWVWVITFERKPET